MAIGLIVSLSTVTGIFLKLPMGAMSDIFNRRRLMIGGLLAFALPPFAYPFVSDLSTLGTLRLLHGLATAIFTPLALATVAEMYSQRRGEALGWYTSATQGGGLLGPMLGGVLIYSIGFSPTFLTAGVIGALSVTIFFFIPKPESSKPRKTQSLKQMIGEFRDGLAGVVKHSGMLATSFAEAAKMMANGTLMAFLPLYGISIGLNPAEIGLLFGIQALTSLLSKPTMGRVSDRFGREPLILLGLCCCGGMIIFMPQTNMFSLLLILAAGFGFGEAVVTSSSAALIADLSQAKAIGAGMGLRGTIRDVGPASGPLVAGFLLGHISYVGGFAIIGAIQFLAALIFGLIMMGIRKPAVL
jgi:MFS family permease